MYKIGRSELRILLLPIVFWVKNEDWVKNETTVQKRLGEKWKKCWKQQSETTEESVGSIIPIEDFKWWGHQTLIVTLIDLSLNWTINKGIRCFVWFWFKSKLLFWAKNWALHFNSHTLRMQSYEHIQCFTNAKPLICLIFIKDCRSLQVHKLLWPI